MTDKFLTDELEPKFSDMLYHIYKSKEMEEMAEIAFICKVVMAQAAYNNGKKSKEE